MASEPTNRKSPDVSPLSCKFYAAPFNIQKRYPKRKIHDPFIPSASFSLLSRVEKFLASKWPEILASYWLVSS